MNTTPEDLRESLLRYIKQKLGMHPFATNDPVHLNVAASNGAVSVEIVSANEPGLEKILSRHVRLAHTFLDRDLSLSQIMGEPYSQLRKYRNIGPISLLRFAEDLKKEGYSYPWMEAAFVHDPKNIDQLKQFPSAQVKRLGKGDWKEMHQLLDDPESLTNEIRLRVIKKIERRNNKAIFLDDLFRPETHPSFYMSYISVINRRFQFRYSDYRIRVAAIPGGDPNRLTAQIVVL